MLERHGYRVYDYGNFTVRDDRYRYIVYADGEEELYDTETDPNQWTNLAGDPRYDAMVRKIGIPVD